jgi:hypothetical protein
LGARLGGWSPAGMHVLARALWQQRCLEVASRLQLGSSMRRVGLIDITVGNATRLGASQRSATRRSASHHIATRRLSRWGSPAARARLARTVPSSACGSERVMSPQVEQMSHPKRPRDPRGPLWCWRHNTAPFSQQGRAIAANSTFR